MNIEKLYTLLNNNDTLVTGLYLLSNLTKEEVDSSLNELYGLLNEKSSVFKIIKGDVNKGFILNFNAKTYARHAFAEFIWSPKYKLRIDKSAISIRNSTHLLNLYIPLVSPLSKLIDLQDKLKSLLDDVENKKLKL